MISMLRRIFQRESPAELAASAWRGRVVGHDAIMVPGPVSAEVEADLRKRFHIGENGPEAILPLKRLPSGKLGVAE